MVADAYPNFSICGIPYYISGEVAHWTDLAHRTAADLAATGMTVLTDTTATRINPKAHSLAIVDANGRPDELSYEHWSIGTGAISARHRSPASRAPTRWAHTTGCTCCIPWATHSR